MNDHYFSTKFLKKEVEEMDQGKMKMISFKVNQEEKNFLENYIFENDITISDLLREALKNYIENLDKDLFKTTKEKELEAWII